MKKKFLLPSLTERGWGVSLLLCLSFSLTAVSAWADTTVGVRSLERAMAVADAAWAKTIVGTPTNLYMADVCNTQNSDLSGPSDVWPYTAAIEAHCSILEALETARPLYPDFYAAHHDRYATQLAQLIDNLEYYRGQLTLSSYANRQVWRPFAVPRASNRGRADVSGILNVYDDQMWLARELIRAYFLTGTESYLAEATSLTDYVLDGWDCWRDSDGREYGGITWGPGYNSKHACSNAPIIQPLVWLHAIYKDRDGDYILHYRDNEGTRQQERLDRSVAYLDWARKIYAWQKEKLLVTSGSDRGVYADMMGADNTIQYVTEGRIQYRAHVDTGDKTGTAHPYNSGTMLAGAAELYTVTGEDLYLTDLRDLAASCYSRFATTQRGGSRFVEFTNNDATAENGFMTWFIDVLLRAFIDAEPYVDTNRPQLALEGHLANLDNAFDNYSRNGLLPIHLTKGWGTEVKTKGFHQFTFASEYAMLANRLLQKEVSETPVSAPKAMDMDVRTDIFTPGGRKVTHDTLRNARHTLPRGLYVTQGQKFTVK